MIAFDCNPSCVEATTTANKVRMDKAALEEREKSQASSQPPTEQERVGPIFDERTVKPARHRFSDVSPELVDMVKLCNAADRVGGGGFVWLGWNKGQGQSDRRKSSLGWGSQLVAVSAWAAREMHANFEKWFEKTHWDMALKNAFRFNEEVRKKVKPSYCHPAIGQFESHWSGCCNVGEREAEWGHPLHQEGTRKRGNDGYTEASWPSTSKGQSPS